MHGREFKKMRTNRKLGWIAIRVDEDFKGVVPCTALDKVPDTIVMSQANIMRRRARTEGC
jgi:hypothetical protein